MSADSVTRPGSTVMSPSTRRAPGQRCRATSSMAGLMSTPITVSARPARYSSTRPVPHAKSIATCAGGRPRAARRGCPSRAATPARGRCGGPRGRGRTGPPWQGRGGNHDTIGANDRSRNWMMAGESRPDGRLHRGRPRPSRAGMGPPGRRHGPPVPVPALLVARHHRGGLPSLVLVSAATAHRRPALERDRHLGVERLRMLGSGVLCPDHLDAVAAPGEERAVAAALRRGSDHAGDGLLDLDGVVTASAGPRPRSRARPRRAQRGGAVHGPRQRRRPAGLAVAAPPHHPRRAPARQGGRGVARWPASRTPARRSSSSSACTRSAGAARPGS